MRYKTREVLVGMKERLSRGFLQGELFDDHAEPTHVCTLGAAVLAADLQPRLVRGDDAPNTQPVPGRTVTPGQRYLTRYYILEGSPIHEALALVAAEAGLDGWRAIPLWQDVRPVDDVIDVLDRVLFKNPVEKERRVPA